MAITRSQQAKQMLQDGGMLVSPSKDGKRPGYRSARAQEVQGRTSSYSGRTGKQGPSAPSVDRSSALQTYNNNIAAGQGNKNPIGPVQLNDREKALVAFQNEKPEVNLFGIANLFKKPIQKFSNFTTAKNRNLFEDVIRAGKFNYKTKDGKSLGFDMTEDELEDAYQNYLSSRLGGEIDAYGNPLNTGNDGGDQIFIPQDMMAEAPSIMDQETEVEEEPFEISRRFRAEGGIMNTDVVGGEMDFDSARQMYGLGKLVKKITRSVKKVAKSPIGKAALIAGGGYLLGGGIIPGVSGKLIPFAKYGNSAGTGFGFGNILPNILNIAKMPGLAEKASSMGSVGNVLTGITAASAIAGMLTPEQEEEAQMISDETGIDIETIRANPNEYLGRRFRAEGGSMDEPVAKKTMPLLDMDGKEMDLRAEGGFVPIGRMEKADDVPARLSKNEFVFTADAVRNAGEGDVDKGAEVMYNMMKNLESGGEVSEESQGLEGAREMFQTSQRLEEVI
jgi:hypothetical protein